MKSRSPPGSIDVLDAATPPMSRTRVCRSVPSKLSTTAPESASSTSSFWSVAGIGPRFESRNS